MRKKILIFSVNWLGDAVFATPFIRAVKEAHPDSYIACAAPPRSKAILESNPRINEVIAYDEDSSEKGLIGKIRFSLRLKKERFDTAFLLHRSFTRALMTAIAGIPRRIGYNTKGRGFLLTDSVNMPPGPPHRVEYFLGLARAAGIAALNKDYEFFVTDADRKKADTLLAEAGITKGDDFVVLNPGANWPPKRWPALNFAGLADSLIESYGIKVLISGSDKDKELCKKITDSMKNKAVSICGMTSLRELAEVFRRAGLVVSADSGPMHIAVSVGARVIALFGPTSPDITGPYGKGRYDVIRKDTGCCTPCYDLGCADYRCMEAISVVDVIALIREKNIFAQKSYAEKNK